MHYLYYLVLFISSDLCAAYYDCFAALTQILRAPCNTHEIGGSCRLQPPFALKEPIFSLLICLMVPSIQPPRPRLIRSRSSNLSGQSGLSLQANFSHTVKIYKGLIYPINLMILLPHLKIEIDTTKPSPIQNSLPSIPLLHPCNTLTLSTLF